MRLRPGLLPPQAGARGRNPTADLRACASTGPGGARNVAPASNRVLASVIRGRLHTRRNGRAEHLGHRGSSARRADPDALGRSIPFAQIRRGHRDPDCIAAPTPAAPMRRARLLSGSRSLYPPALPAGSLGVLRNTGDADCRSQPSGRYRRFTLRQMSAGLTPQVAASSLYVWPKAWRSSSSSSDSASGRTTSDYPGITAQRLIFGRGGGTRPPEMITGSAPNRVAACRLACRRWSAHRCSVR